MRNENSVSSFASGLREAASLMRHAVAISERSQREHVLRMAGCVSHARAAFDARTPEVCCALPGFRLGSRPPADEVDGTRYCLRLAGTQRLHRRAWGAATHYATPARQCADSGATASASTNMTKRKAQGPDRLLADRRDPVGSPAGGSLHPSPSAMAPTR